MTEIPAYKRSVMHYIQQIAARKIKSEPRRREFLATHTFFLSERKLAYGSEKYNPLFGWERRLLIQCRKYLRDRRHFPKGLTARGALQLAFGGYASKDLSFSIILYELVHHLEGMKRHRSTTHDQMKTQEFLLLGREKMNVHELTDFLDGFNKYLKVTNKKSIPLNFSIRCAKVSPHVALGLFYKAYFENQSFRKSFNEIGRDFEEATDGKLVANEILFECLDYLAIFTILRLAKRFNLDLVNQCFDPHRREDKSSVEEDLLMRCHAALAGEIQRQKLAIICRKCFKLIEYDNKNRHCDQGCAGSARDRRYYLHKKLRHLKESAQ